MSQNSNRYGRFAHQLQSARDTYDKDRRTDPDAHEDYMVRCFTVALSIAAAEIAERYQQYQHLPTALSVSRPAVQGLAATVAHHLSCPIDNGHDHEDFIRAWYSHSMRYLDHDTPQVVKELLHHLGLRDINHYTRNR